MNRQPSLARLLPLAAGLTILLFVAGIVWLFQLRFSIGDIYAPYSSLRADLLGTAALHDALAMQPSTDVRRLYDPILKLPQGAGCTLFILGTHPQGLHAEVAEMTELDRFLRDGGRVVISCRPAAPEMPAITDAADSPPEKPTKPDGKKNGDKKKPDNDRKKAEEEKKLADRDVLAADLKEIGKAYGFRFVRSPSQQMNDKVAAITKPTGGLKNELPWHGDCRLEFDSVAPWLMLYAVNREPVIAQRRIGSGTLVLIADSWHLSNEALSTDRQLELLSWLVGSSAHTVLFEESHLGTQHRQGVMSLIRRYRLVWVLLSFAAVALLYIWRQAAGGLRTPAETEETIQTIPTGQETAAGLLHLLKRNIPAGSLLKTCIEQWDADHGRQAPPGTAAAALDKLPSGQASRQSLADHYRMLCETLRKKSRKTG